MSFDWQAGLRKLGDHFEREARRRDLWHGYVIESNVKTPEEQWGLIGISEPITRKSPVGRTKFRTPGDGVYFGTIDPMLFRADADAAFRCVAALPIANGIRPGPTRDHSDGWLQVVYRLAAESATPFLQARVRERQVLDDEGGMEYVIFAVLERDVYASSAAAADLLLDGKTEAIGSNILAEPSGGWTRPELVSTWMRAFGWAHRNTAYRRLKKQQPRNKKVGNRFMVAIEDLPEMVRQRYRPAQS